MLVCCWIYAVGSFSLGQRSFLPQTILQNTAVLIKSLKIWQIKLPKIILYDLTLLWFESYEWCSLVTCINLLFSCHCLTFMCISKMLHVLINPSSLELFGWNVSCLQVIGLDSMSILNSCLKLVTSLMYFRSKWKRVLNNNSVSRLWVFWLRRNSWVWVVRSRMLSRRSDESTSAAWSWMPG